MGSFGDNELSPECLDGVQKFLKGVITPVSYNNYYFIVIIILSEDGISIPCSYNSYLTPVLAHKLHTSIEECKDTAKVSIYIITFLLSSLLLLLYYILSIFISLLYFL